MATKITESNQDFMSAVHTMTGKSMGPVSIKPMIEYQMRPIDFMIDRLGVKRRSLYWSENPNYDNHRWDGDPDPFIQAANVIADGGDVGLESGTGTGKTYWLACMTLWFLSCYEDAMVVTVAPKEAQLLLHVWKEIGRQWDAFSVMWPHASLKQGKLRMRPEVNKREIWTAAAFVCGVGADEESATKAQGFHAEHMLIITEETPGIDPAIMRALDNTRTDDHNIHLAVGNPDNQHDGLHRFCIKPSTEHLRISALDHPNIVSNRRVVPGAVSLKRERERAAEYGEDGQLYQSRIRGISPSEAADALIKLAWCHAAAARYDDPLLREGPEALGVDVAASLAGDKAAIARFMGACCMEVTSFQCPDPVALGVQVAAEMGTDIDPWLVGVDSVGVGSATVHKLRELGLWVRALNAGSRPTSTIDKETERASDVSVVEQERFYNLRSQMWWYTRRDLQRGYVSLPNDIELFEDLTTPTWWTRNGKIYVESKEDLKKRLQRSPDKGDAFIMGNWVRQRNEEKPEVEEAPISAFDPAVLKAEREFVYRCRNPKPPESAHPLMVTME